MLSRVKTQYFPTTASHPQLQLGSTGSAVIELEKLLIKVGAYRKAPTGIFDKSVDFAVKLFQFRVFLEPDGIVGPLTWQALYAGTPVNMPILKLGSSGPAVVTVQEILRITRHYQDAIHGEFTPQTEIAVRAFQRSFDLVPDGIVGPKTWAALSQIPRGYNPSF